MRSAELVKASAITLMGQGYRSQGQSLENRSHYLKNRTQRFNRLSEIQKYYHTPKHSLWQFRVSA